jgi:hypothetical protein
VAGSVGAWATPPLLPLCVGGKRELAPGDVAAAQCEHCDECLNRGQPFCQPLPAIAFVVAGEQCRTSRNKHDACVIHSDLPYHRVKLRGQALLQAYPVFTTIVAAVQGCVRALAPARRRARRGGVEPWSPAEPWCRDAQRLSRCPKSVTRRTATLRAAGGCERSSSRAVGA